MNRMVFPALASVCALSLTVACGWFGQKKQTVGSGTITKTLVESTETVAENTPVAGYSGPPATEDLDLDNRRVFYRAWEENGKYRISKRDAIFIIDDRIVIVDIPHEPFTYAIKSITYQGDSIVTAVLDNTVSEWKYYRDLLKGKKLQWSVVERSDDEQIMKMVKNPETLIWSESGVHGSQFIDTYDIIPSGHYYQNQITTRHDPDNENFLIPEKPALTGVFDLDEEPQTLVADSEEYRNMEKPFEGKWLELTMTDIGYVVYDYPNMEGGEAHSIDFINVEKNTISHMVSNGELLTTTFDEIMTWPVDGSFYLWGGNDAYSFKWVDQTRHIAQWTRYHNHSNKRIFYQYLYIKEGFNSYPVVMYDWD